MYIYTLKHESVDWIRTYLILNSPTFSGGNECHNYNIQDKNFYIVRGMFYYLKEDKLYTLLYFLDKPYYSYVFDIIKQYIIIKQCSNHDFPYLPQYIWQE